MFNVGLILHSNYCINANVYENKLFHAKTTNLIVMNLGT